MPSSAISKEFTLTLPSQCNLHSGIIIMAVNSPCSSIEYLFVPFYSGNNLNPVVELFFGQSNVEGVYEGSCYNSKNSSPIGIFLRC